MDIIVYVFTLTRLILGSIFLISGINKIESPYHFAKVITTYRIFPHKWMSHPVAFLVISLEISIGILIILGWQVQFVALISTLLTIGFVLVVGVALMRKQELECGCFGKSHSKKVSLKTFILDIVLLMASIIIFLNHEAFNVLSMDSQPLSIRNTVFSFILFWLLPMLLIGVGTLLAVRLLRNLFEIISLLPNQKEQV